MADLIEQFVGGGGEPKGEGSDVLLQSAVNAQYA
jgi:hypothetical protein